MLRKLTEKKKKNDQSKNNFNTRNYKREKNINMNIIKWEREKERHEFVAEVLKL